MPEQFYDADTYRARDSVGYLVRRLTSILTARIESAFEPHDFTLTQWSVLMHLRDGLATTASDLASAFQHDSGALTRLLDQLEQRSLIVRRRSTRDISRSHSRTFGSAVATVTVCSSAAIGRNWKREA